jgi:hypothetical protein
MIMIKNLLLDMVLRVKEFVRSGHVAFHPGDIMHGRADALELKESVVLLTVVINCQSELLDVKNLILTCCNELLEECANSAKQLCKESFKKESWITGSIMHVE